MNKNFLSKNIIGLAALAIGVILVVGFVVASDSNDSSTVANNTNNSVSSDIEEVDNQNEEIELVEEIEDVDESLDSNETVGSETAEPEIPEVTVTLNSVEVANHSTAADCWTIVNSNVYDITNYIPRHPGGDEILRACGTDGTALFTSGATESGEQVKSRGGHSTSAEVQLESFLQGPLVK